jgi:hypothetical protein
LVGTVSRTQKCLPPTGIRFHDHSAHSIFAAETTLFRLLPIAHNLPVSSRNSITLISFRLPLVPHTWFPKICHGLKTIILDYLCLLSKHIRVNWTKDVAGHLTLSNPFFLPTAYTPAIICFGRERGWWVTCNYPTVLKEKNIEKQKEYNLRYLLAKVRNTWGKASDRVRQRGTNATKTLSDVFRHRSGTGKSYRRTSFDVGSERVKSLDTS